MAHPRARPSASLVAAVLASACVVLSAASTADRAAVTRRVVLLSLDSGADWIVDKLIAEGKAPAFARLAREGTVAEGMVATWPSLTAVAHATLWTGAPPAVHGVSGNLMPFTPGAGSSVLGQQSGYLGGGLRSEPIWVTAARAGRRTLVLQATQQVPFAEGFTSDTLLQFDVYANALLPSAVVEGDLKAGDHIFAVGDDEVRLQRAEAMGVTVTSGGTSSTVRPTEGQRWTGVFGATVRGRRGVYRAGLLSYDVATGKFTLARSRVSQIVGSEPAQTAVFAGIAGVITEAGLGTWFGGGRFGKPMAAGGDGEAERAFSEALAVNHEYFERSLEYAQQRPWDFLVCYVSSLDLVNHAFVGMLDPASSVYTPALAARVWPVVEALYSRLADRYVADLRRRFPDATLVVTSDHGVEGTGRILYPNAILQQAGLLVLGPDRRVDLGRTRAVYLDARGGIVTVNATSWQEGIVRDAERSAVIRRVTQALLNARDPDTGERPIRAVLDPERDGRALGFGGPGVDLVFDPAPDYAPSARLGTTMVAESSAPLGEGEHGPAPWRRKLHGIFYAAGPGVREGVTIPLMQSTDVAPTVSRLLGIPAPAQAVGRALPITSD